MSNINFSLLETARLLRQKTQKEVVEAIGISQASLSKAEHGLQELPIDIMSKLYDYYDLPETFFLRSEGVSPLGHLYYRKKLTITNKVIDSFLWIFAGIAVLFFVGFCNSKLRKKEEKVFEEWVNGTVWFNRAFKFYGHEIYANTERAMDAL